MGTFTLTLAYETIEQTKNKSSNRGCLFYIKRGLMWFGIALIALVVLGVAYQSIATEADKRNFAPRGQLYTVNGHQMHLVCMGEGNPTVILQAGATADSLWWHRIQNQLSEHTRVCAYDRPGLGFSEPTTGAHDPLTITDELHTLLAEAGVDTPYIVAGHSFGAVLARIYATQYPDEVAGIVLIDSQMIDEPFVDQNAFDQWKSSNDTIQIVLWALVRSGVARLLFSGQFSASGYPAEIAHELGAMQIRNQTFDTDYAERITAMWEITKASARSKDFNDLPVTVIWAPTPGGVYANDDALAAALARREEFSSFSSNTVTLIIDGADHLSLLGNGQHAQQVSDAILDVIEAANTGARHSQ